MENEDQYGRPRLKRKPFGQMAESPKENTAQPAAEQPAQTDTPQPGAVPPDKQPEQTAASPSQIRPARQERPDRPDRRHDRRPSRTSEPRRDRQGSARPAMRQDRQTFERSTRGTKVVPRNDSIKLSVVIPAYNEEGNIAPLMEQFKAFFSNLPYRAEMILVDDGSTDKTPQRLREAQLQYSWLKVYTHRINLGLTAALETGISKAGGNIICFYPADLQYHASDIAKMVAKIDAGCDVVTGKKQGNYGLRSIASFIYNWLSRRLFKVKVHDLNSVKAFKKEVTGCFIYRRGWHRYMIVMAAGAGYKIEEIPVKLYPRKSGKSKFGIWRLPAGLLDLISVKLQLSFSTKPLLLFGSAGMISCILGFLIGLVAIYLRFIEHSGFRPLLYLVILLIVSGLLLFFGGFLGELIVSVKEEIRRTKETKNS